jgi:hypothetical protein
LEVPYCQSEDDGFVVWIYPDRLMVAKEKARRVRKLIEVR